MSTKWFSRIAEGILREAGIGKGQIILDFGCGSGNYAIPAAEIIGSEGWIYALDKNERALSELRRRAELSGLENVRIINAGIDSELPLQSHFVDAVFLFDVLHSYYFPLSSDRKAVLYEVYRVLKVDGFVLFYAGDPEVYHSHSELNAIRKEIKDAEFYLESECCGMIIHEDKLEEGCVLRFSRRNRRG